jgi:shikimate kinase
VTDERALLLTGVYGTGKSTVAEEIADILESTGQSYAAIDLDWLCWSNAEGSGHGEFAILARNLAAVSRNYREAGVRHFVLAGSVEDAATLDAIRSAVGATLTVVRLTAPLTVIEERLGGSPTRGRADDLARARELLATSSETASETAPQEALPVDAVIENAGPIRQTALAVLDAAGWRG